MQKVRADILSGSLLFVCFLAYLPMQPCEAVERQMRNDIMNGRKKWP
jgi:hypothetical protein